MKTPRRVGPSPGRELEHGAVELPRPPAGKLARAHLRAGQVGKHPDESGPSRRPHGRRGGARRDPRAGRGEVEPHHVDAGGAAAAVEHLRRLARRPEGGDDLRSTPVIS